MNATAVNETTDPPVVKGRGSSPMTLRIPLDGSVPTEVCLFKYGVNDTTKGEFTFDEESAASVMREDAAYGNKRSADYEHQALQDPPIEAPAAAWYRLELRPAGLYAVDIEWTDKARAYIEAREYRYISPAFMYDPESMKIMSVINFALTNLPATRRMDVLLRADPLADFLAHNTDTLTENGLMTEQQKAALRDGARLYAEAVVAAVKTGSVTDKTPAPEVETLTDEPDELPGEHLHGSSPLQGADSSRTTPAPTHEKDVPMEEQTISTILAALGLRDDATETEIKNAVAALKAPKAEQKDGLEPVRAALSLSEGDAKTVVKAVAALKAELDAKTEALSVLQADIEEQSVSVLLADAKAAGKVTEDTAKLYVEALTSDAPFIERLRTLLDGLPKLAVLNTPRKEPAQKSSFIDKKYGDLSPMQKVALKTEDPELYDQLRAEHYSKS
jgi:phage I-like protein